MLQKVKKSLSNRFVIALLTAVGIFGLGTAVYAASEYQFTNEQVPTTDIKISGGVIRIDPVQGVYLHTNNSHHSVGIESVGIDPDTGYLHIQRYKGDAIVSVVATPDETLAAKGITFGPSGGGRNTYLKLYNRNGQLLDLRKQSDYDQVASSLSNVWIAFFSH